MKILTFDIEDWYNCDFYSGDLNWDKYETRIYKNVDRILFELDQKNIKGTFFCLGWLAEKHPLVIRQIKDLGHHIGCHSYQHQLAYNFTREQFIQDTDRAKKILEDTIGAEINAYRAPGFSITNRNLSYFDVLSGLGFLYDASVFPSSHDYGGIVNFGDTKPFIIETPNGVIKEFPMNVYDLYLKSLVFSGGGFFRILPYQIIKYLSSNSEYIMTYFHPRDFDPDQPIMKNLTLMRKFKSYVGLKSSFMKFQKYLLDFDFNNIEQSNLSIDWDTVKHIKI